MNRWQVHMNMSAPAKKAPARKRARVQTMLLALICLLAGVGMGAFWFYRTPDHGVVQMHDKPAGQAVLTLSAGTKSVLHHLDSPVEIRFYSLLDPAGVPDSLQILAGRVDQLLSAYQQEAGAKLKVTHYGSRTDLNTAAATKDGIQPFIQGKGDACYLGLAVEYKGQKEAIPRLAPEWEQALESDLSRAIARVISSSPPANANVTAAQTDPAVTAEVKRQIPNFASVSLEEGTQLLRDAGLQDFKAAMSEMQAHLREAEQRLSRTLDGKSEAERQAARLHLQQVQAEQAAKLKEIATRSLAQIEALRQLKEAAQ